MNIFSVYALQAGGTDEAKEQFWAALQEKLEKVDESERCIIGGEMNGHVGSDNDAISRIRGGNAYGNGDEDGEKVIDLALSFDMVIGNTLFRKRNEHLIAYESGDRASQIDFLLYRRRNIRKIKNCKVIPGDHVTEQHRLVVIDLTIAVSQKQKRKLQLREGENDRILRELSHDRVDVNTWWNDAKSITLRAGKEIFGESSGKVWENKEIWWFNEEVQGKMSAKKKAKKNGKKVNKMKTEQHINSVARELRKQLPSQKNYRYLRGNEESNDQEIAEITREEVNAELEKIKNGKAPGPDDIPVEVWKALGEEGVDMFRWIDKRDTGKQYQKNAIFKEKGYIQSCENY
ncbi:uncharacterized protein LOC119584589 [Penaeus monodon]|uniref:uncharacterized protein LOC119584589 n=1 Tax=Penaeus monodon TaxID=6687 RepID=UPI0018A7281C|nr:uncharacterized protein LOC119584589 [Penaeus monodon]